MVTKVDAQIYGIGATVIVTVENCQTVLYSLKQWQQREAKLLLLSKQRRTTANDLLAIGLATACTVDENGYIEIRDEIIETGDNRKPVVSSTSLMLGEKANG